MKHKLEALKEQALSLKYPKWKRVVSAILLSLLCLLMVADFIYLIVSTPGASCYKGFIALAVVWCTAELAVVAYLYFSQTLPKFARDLVILVILFSNIWFGLFVFGLDQCVAG